ncbi:hypothetical protein [Streptomyces griseorubiginosus]|uniref:hypothetical protein n=1 Tax=Streptomyces griseorubiginosus TaxID=67304 RepID=UPI002E8015FD|nr:hypothetical protein [Streptomyces griseorubiginosus]WUB45623.1 hypothetical protein OHN19_20610 [Streptomyces griseorubiginosus]WUB54141.1 hypothetical protein OG942_20610 [Streptomyces griseorubiginosus]
MRHQQVLDKLAARGIVQGMVEDVARWTAGQMAYPGRSHAEVEKAVVPPVLTRWRCLLEDADATATDKNVGWVALATVLHKHGFHDSAVTARALASVDELNRHVVLSDAFARQSPAVKALLRSAPTPLTRRPRRPAAVTFLRPGDVVSIRLADRFHAAHVHDLHGANEFPVIEFYAGSFTGPPTMTQLTNRPAARADAGARFGVVGLTHLPDPARQVLLLASQHARPPHGGAPRPGNGLWTLTDLLDLPTATASLRSTAGPN